VSFYEKFLLQAFTALEKLVVKRFPCPRTAVWLENNASIARLVCAALKYPFNGLSVYFETLTLESWVRLSLSSHHFLCFVQSN